MVPLPLLELDETMLAPPPLMTLEQLLSLAPESERLAWEVIETAVDAISAHYLLDRDIVWGAVIDLEIEMESTQGLPNFGRLLESPWGYTALGMSVVEHLFGAEAAGWPALHLTFQ